jgi:hypothetical protein
VQRVLVTVPEVGGGGTTTNKVFPVTQWRTNLSTRTYIDTDGSGVSTDAKPGLALVNTNIRYRDGSIAFFNNTDLNGNALRRYVDTANYGAALAILREAAVNDAALKGCSFYDMPRVLHWLTGNIGFHHIHHLSPRIPNYNLEKCHRAEPLFQTVKPVTLFSSFKSFTFRLWDEQRGRLVGYRALRAIRNQKGRASQPALYRSDHRLGG